MTKEELIKAGMGLKAVDEAVYRKVLRRWDALAKPLDGLGLFEKITAQIGGIRRTDRPSVKNRTLLLFLSDNGIVEEGVSQSDASVTHSVAEAIAENRSTVCVMAEQAGVAVFPVDIGMKGEVVSGISFRRIKDGTRDFLREPAMTEEETLAAIDTGRREAARLAEEGCELLLLGEMGIGNTTTATALGCAFLKTDPALVTGRGAGLPDEGLARKKEVIREGLARYDFDPEDALEVLSLFGGFDIAGMVGAILACMERHVPVVADGLITLAAVLTAERLFPGAKDVCIASHRPAEAMGALIMDALGLTAPVDAGLALGEGTGGVLLMPILDVCMAYYDRGSRFEGIGVEAYTRFEGSASE